jgi:parallel beta-helix repeat protein
MSLRSRRPAHRSALALLALLTGWLGLAAGPALAQPLGCGAVVTQSVTLAADLLDCQGDGLVIGASGITVDLNGHTISGQIISGGDPDQVGIDNSAGHDGVTIRNGVVRHFARGGVHLVGTDRNRVQELRMDLFGDFAILLEGGGSANQITGNTMDSASTVGIGIFGVAAPSRDNRITGNVANGADTANIALRFGTITGTVIEDNTANNGDSEDDWGAAITVGSRYTSREGDIRGTVVRRNSMDFNFSGGVFVGDAASDTLVERNLVDNSFGLPAIESDGDRTLIRRNTIRSSYFVGSTNFGIQVDARAQDNRVEINTIDRAASFSIEDRGDRTLVSANVMTGQIFPDMPITGAIAGINVGETASGGRILANVVRRHAPGFAEDVGGGIVIAGDNFTVTGNVVDEIDFTDGIRVEAAASGTLLRANVATRNRDDGIDVNSPATTVTANVANDNEDLGIEAVPGVTDGGGNRARGNGNPAQCVGVRCAP